MQDWEGDGQADHERDHDHDHDHMWGNSAEWEKLEKKQRIKKTQAAALIDPGLWTRLEKLQKNNTTGIDTSSMYT